MRHGTSSRRQRNRNNNNRRGNQQRTQVYDSNGPDVRIRGTAHQVAEKYLALAKDAASSGDRIVAENYYQHAEHYIRIINEFDGKFNSSKILGYKSVDDMDDNAGNLTDNSNFDDAEVDDLGLPSSIVGHSVTGKEAMADS